MALAREQMKTQTPSCSPSSGEASGSSDASTTIASSAPAEEDSPDGTTDTAVMTSTIAPGIPLDWPDPRGFVSPPPTPSPPPCWPSDAPVLQHTRTYNGNDSEFTEALASYYYFRDDARFGGWQSYLERSDDFIRFCCHKHIWEMLSARGGAGETRVVWRWSSIR
jgi:hypothetical protein